MSPFYNGGSLPCGCSEAGPCGQHGPQHPPKQSLAEGPTFNEWVEKIAGEEGQLAEYRAAEELLDKLVPDTKHLPLYGRITAALSRDEQGEPLPAKCFNCEAQEGLQKVSLCADCFKELSEAQ